MPPAGGSARNVIPAPVLAPAPAPAAAVAVPAQPAAGKTTKPATEAPAEGADAKLEARGDEDPAAASASASAAVTPTHGTAAASEDHVVAPHVIGSEVEDVAVELEEAHHDPDKVVCGYLLKRGDRRAMGRKFQDRYIVLDGGVLSYYNKDTEYDRKKKPNKSRAIALRHYSVVRGPDEGSKGDAALNFMLVPLLDAAGAKDAGIPLSSSGKPRVFDFRAAKQEDRDAWMRCFRKENCAGEAELRAWLAPEGFAKLRVPPGPDPVADVMADSPEEAAAAVAEEEPAAEGEAAAEEAGAAAAADGGEEEPAAEEAEVDAEAITAAAAAAAAAAAQAAETEAAAAGEEEAGAAEGKEDEEGEQAAAAEAVAAEGEAAAAAEAVAATTTAAAVAAAEAEEEDGEDEDAAEEDGEAAGEEDGEAAAAASASSGSTVTKRGSLIKRAEKKFRWEERNLVLAGGKVTYMKGTKVRKSPRNPITVSEWSVAAPGSLLEDAELIKRTRAAKRLTPDQIKAGPKALSEEQAGVFLVLRPAGGKGVPFYFEAGSAEERDSWADALVEAGAGTA